MATKTIFTRIHDIQVTNEANIKLVKIGKCRQYTGKSENPCSVKKKEIGSMIPPEGNGKPLE